MNETTAAVPRALRIAAPVLLALAAIALWQILTDVYAVPSYLVPSPALVLRTLVTDRELLLRSLAVTLGIALVALVLATVLGTLTALLFVQSRWIEMSLFPYAVMLQVTPIVAIAPLIIIWVKHMDRARPMRSRRGDLSDHLEYNIRAAQR